jgi:2-dehydropantoate 2-reductase
MRYVIIGPDAIGGTLSALLARAGFSVVVVARGAHAAAIRARGVYLATPAWTSSLPVPVVARPEELELEAGDVILLTVKSQDTAAAVSAWAGARVRGGGTAGETTPLVCVQNGVDNERTATRSFRHVVAVSAWMPTTLLAPGSFAAYGTPVAVVLDVGRYPSAADARVDGIVRDLAKSNLRAHALADVMPWKYGKLLSNLGNAVQAICGLGGGAAVGELCARAEGEARACYRAAGIAHVDLEAAHRARGDVLEMGAIEGVERRGGSTWQSLQRGARVLESD